MTTLSWSWLRGYRFEKLAVLALVMLLAIGEADAINAFVQPWFGAVAQALAH